jgi:hypothetical protein
MLIGLLLAAGCNGAYAETTPIGARAPMSEPPAPPSPQPHAPPAPPPDPSYTLFVDEARLDASHLGAAWCADGSTPDVRVGVTLGQATASSGVAPGLDATFGAPMLYASAHDFTGGFAIAVEASCAGQAFFAAGSAQLMPTLGDLAHGPLEIDGFGAVDVLRLHFALGFSSGGGGGGSDGGSGGDSGGSSDGGSDGSGGGGGWVDPGSGMTGTPPSDGTGSSDPGTVADNSGSTDPGASDPGSTDTGSSDTSGSDSSDDSGSWVDTSGDTGSSDTGSSADDSSDDASSTDDGSGDDSAPVDELLRRPHHVIKRVETIRLRRRAVVRSGAPA